MAQASKATKLADEAAALFGVKMDRIQSVLWALGLREPCTRCGGSGHYSRCQQYGTTCFKCAGRRETSAKLTRKVLDAARVKVAAGELDAARERSRVLRAAKAQIAPLVARAREVYLIIGDAYTKGSRANDQAGRLPDGSFDYDVHHAAVAAFVKGPLFRAQGMNNAIFYGYLHTGRPARLETSVSDIQRAVESGTRRDYTRCVAEIEEAIAMLEALRDAWIAFSA